MNPWHVYILKCADGTLYTGITNDLAKRLALHNSGKASKYTRARLPVKIVWNQEVKGRSEASKEESRIKKLPKNEKQHLIDRKKK